MSKIERTRAFLATFMSEVTVDWFVRCFKHPGYQKIYIQLEVNELGQGRWSAPADCVYRPEPVTSNTSYVVELPVSLIENDHE